MEESEQSIYAFGDIQASEFIAYALTKGKVDISVVVFNFYKRYLVNFNESLPSSDDIILLLNRNDETGRMLADILFPEFKEAVVLINLPRVKVYDTIFVKLNYIEGVNALNSMKGTPVIVISHNKIAIFDLDKNYTSS